MVFSHSYPLARTSIMRRAFTLIEMVIVITILAVIMTAVIGKLQQVQSRARDTSRKVNVKQIGDALSLYMTDNGNYPTGARLTTDFGPNGPIPLVPSIMRSLPTDAQTMTYSLGILTPNGYLSSTSGAYGYVSIPGGGTQAKYGMVLVSKLENYKMGNWIATDDLAWSLVSAQVTTGGFTYYTGAAAVTTGTGPGQAVNILSTSNLNLGLCTTMNLVAGLTYPQITTGSSPANFVPANQGVCNLPDAYKGKVKYIYVQG